MAKAATNIELSEISDYRDFLKAYRLSQKPEMSLKFVAEHTSMDKDQLHRVEMKRSEMRVLDFIKLCRFYRVNPDKVADLAEGKLKYEDVIGAK